MAIKIMIVRHGEKPAEDGSIRGVSRNGLPDEDELTVRGWQRAGALAQLLKSPPTGNLNSRLAIPDTIFATRADHHAKSLRSQHTVLSLADSLELRLDLRFAKGEEEALASEMVSRTGVILIAWEHKRIPKIISSLVGHFRLCPQIWPDDRFDLIWVLDQNDGELGWRFEQIPPNLLPGDRNEVIE